MKRLLVLALLVLLFLIGLCLVGLGGVSSVRRRCLSRHGLDDVLGHHDRLFIGGGIGRRCRDDSGSGRGDHHHPGHCCGDSFPVHVTVLCSRCLVCPVGLTDDPVPSGDTNMDGHR